MEMLNSSNQFQTSDVYIATTATALGHPLIAIDREDPMRCRFIFENTPELQEVVDGFWRKQLLLEPQMLFASLRSLKWQLHNN